MKNYKKLGDYIEVLYRRNTDLKLGLDSVRGISNTKQITETSKATVDESVISKFYVINPGEFVYNPRTTRMGDKVGLAFNNTDKPLLFTFNNLAFRIKDSAKYKLLPDYLYLFFCRSEFDRYARINSWGSATELFLFEDLCNIKFAVPDLKEQKKIVNTYNAITKRIQLKQKINENLEKTAQTIYKKMFVEYADENWKTIKLGECIEVKYGKDHKILAEGSIPVYGSGGIMRYAEKALFEKESVLIPRKGSLNNILYVDEPFWSVDTMFYTEMKRNNFAKYLYEFIRTKDFLNLDTGSAVPSMTTEYLNNIEILNPDDLSLEKFESNVSKIYISKKNNLKEISKLQELKQLVISRISKI